MSNKFEITEINSFMVDGIHKVDISHSHKKKEWFVTIKGEFYTEFTFGSQQTAEAMFEVLATSCTSVFMDSMLISTIKRELEATKSDVVKSVSPEAIDYELACNEMANKEGR